ncbi:MAG: PDZ domain-containing protein [Proteobacteria bacterium]|nr:PDZ domain-containing protein [Pseudomonadota bacterium]
MKTYNKTLTALLLAGLTTVINAQTQQDIEVRVNDDNGIITEEVMVNGQQLDAAGITQLEADGDVQIIHLNGSEATNAESRVLVKTGKHNVTATTDEIEISVSTDGDEVTKTVMLNGKTLNEEEIAELEASGKLKTINIDAPTGNSNQIVKMLTKTIHIDNGDRATLGFMTNIKQDGWHVISVSEGSGAEDAGLKTGDIVKFMGERDLTNSADTILEQLSKKPQYKEGEMVDFEVERDGKLIYMSVEARKNDSVDMILGKGSDIAWTDTLQELNIDSFGNGQKIKLMLVNGNDLGSSINLDSFDNFDINLPDILGNMNVFIANGHSTAKLLGKNHEMSTLSAGMSSYFGTTGGVLLMHVDKDNVFGLQDGDVIKNIDGTDVATPKDVIKQLLKAEKQEAMKLKIVRYKKSKTLKYNK